MSKIRELIKNDLGKVKDELRYNISLTKRYQLENKFNRDTLTVLIDAKNKLNLINDKQLAGNLEIIISNFTLRYATNKNKINKINKEITELKSSYSSLSKVMSGIDNETI